MGENLKQALHLAGRGLRVFPLIEGTDEPAFDRFYDRASSDPKVIEGWFSGKYRDCNVAVSTGDGLIVFDADVKNGGKGLQSLAQMEMEGFDPSFTVSTRSGGRHAYCLYDPETFGEIAGSVRKLKGFPDIDVRCHHNYVVAPGSVIKGKTYDIIDDVPVTPAPDWMVKLAKEAKVVREKADAAPLIELDTEPSIQRATLYLKDDAPAAQEGAGGSDTTYSVAAKVKDFGISESMCFELMDHYWNEQKAFPMWMPDELEIVIGNAYRYGTSSPGVLDARAEFDAVEIAEPANDYRLKKTNRKFQLITTTAARALAFGERKAPLIEGILYAETFSEMYGNPNAGKTFAAMYMGFCIAAGLPWDGHKTERSAVVHILAEGSMQAAAARITAAENQTGLTGVPYFLIKDIVDLRSSDTDLKELVLAIRETLAEHCPDLPLGLVIVDTLNMAFGGGNENANEDMSAFTTNVKKLMLHLKSAALVIHHCGITTGRARGSTVLLGAVDTEIELTREDGKKNGTMRCTKQRDDEKFKDKTYTLESVHLGVDASGRDVKTANFLFVSQAQLEFEAKMDVPPALQDYLDVLAAVVADFGGPAGVKAWDTAYAASLDGRKAPDARTTQRYRRDLLESGRIVRDGQNAFTFPETEKDDTE